MRAARLRFATRVAGGARRRVPGKPATPGHLPYPG